MNNLSTGMAASSVLGQPNLTTGGSRPAAANVTVDPENLIYDPVNQDLFVQDDTFNRILIFNVASITPSEDAVAVIGQPDFSTTDYSCNPSQTSLCDSEGINDAFDPVNRRLFLSDSGNERVLTFDFVKITTPAGALSGGNIGTAYHQTFQASNAQGSLSFRLVSGNLPPGITLDAATGTLGGTPTTAGTYTFEIAADDDNGPIGIFTHDPSYTVTVGPPSISAPNTGLAISGGGNPALTFAGSLGVAALAIFISSRYRRNSLARRSDKSLQ
jgi:hypothetical protein